MAHMSVHMHRECRKAATWWEGNFPRAGQQPEQGVREKKHYTYRVIMLDLPRGGIFPSAGVAPIFTHESGCIIRAYIRSLYVCDEMWVNHFNTVDIWTLVKWDLITER